MRIKICTCSGRPETVFLLTETEKDFFCNDPERFLSFVNQQLKTEQEFSEYYMKQLSFDELMEQNERLKKELNELKQKQ